MKFKLFPILIIAALLGAVSACTSGNTGQESSVTGVVYRSPT